MNIIILGPETDLYMGQKCAYIKQNLFLHGTKRLPNKQATNFYETELGHLGLIKMGLIVTGKYLSGTEMHVI